VSVSSGLHVIKAHAYGNDFLLVADDTSSGQPGFGNRSALARALCNRHEGIGADGLILYESRTEGASMQLFNADGSPSELSGNGVRCLAVAMARRQRLAPGAIIVIQTEAGSKRLELLARDATRYTFRAALGQPDDIRQIAIPVQSETVTATVLRMGNPQCVVLGPLPDPARFHQLGPLLSTHAMFPSGTNVEFAHVEAPDRVRILIWERGVGPTTSSGTGACASAVAAAAHGGALRDADIVAPGGTQRVEWRTDGVYLTGWAEIVLEGEWLLRT
jgi:diaminopimelate epimerase